MLRPSACSYPAVRACVCIPFVLCLGEAFIESKERSKLAERERRGRRTEIPLLVRPALAPARGECDNNFNAAVTTAGSRRTGGGIGWHQGRLLLGVGRNVAHQPNAPPIHVLKPEISGLIRASSAPSTGKASLSLAFFPPSPARARGAAGGCRCSRCVIESSRSGSSSSCSCC